MAKVSVIIPAYNSAPFIESAIRSVTAQSERDIEVIVVDDGSNDDTFALASHVAEGDSRVKVLRQPNSGKPAIARNVGLRHASGEFVGFLDSDDLYHPNKLQRQLAIFAAYPESDIVFHDVKYMSFDGTLLPDALLDCVNYVTHAGNALRAVEPNIYLGSASFYNFMSVEMTGMHTSAVLVRRQLIEQQESAFAEDLVIGEDIDLWFRLTKGRQVAFVNEELSYYRQHPTSITTNTEKLLLGGIAAHSRNLVRARDVLNPSEIRRYQSRIAGQYKNLGYLYFRAGKEPQARSAYANSLRQQFNFGVTLALAKTFAPRWIVSKYRGLDRT
jgi:glycosyltransferase involved in cell wall biosynthesis